MCETELIKIVIYCDFGHKYEVMFLKKWIKGTIHSSKEISMCYMYALCVCGISISFFYDDVLMPAKSFQSFCGFGREEALLMEN